MTTIGATVAIVGDDKAWGGELGSLSIKAREKYVVAWMGWGKA